MEEVVRINLDNEMDLILAHKRTMKLAELCSLSLSAQTTFATAVSEIARCAISRGDKSYMVLGIELLPANRKKIVASLFDKTDLKKANSDALLYAEKLVGLLESHYSNGMYEIRLAQTVPYGGTISASRIKSFADYFINESPLSPYDEIRKKNIQLIELSRKLADSEKQYRLLTETLPLMMFAADKQGNISFANKWLKDFINQPSKTENGTKWYSMLHAADVEQISATWSKSLADNTIFRTQARIQQKDKAKYLWHLVTVLPLKTEQDITGWIGFCVDIDAQKQVEETLKDNEELKLAKQKLEEYQVQLEENIEELNKSNRNLEQFAYIASHDLQEPLRKIRVYSDIISRSQVLKTQEQVYFDKIISSSERMSVLIKDVLNYSRLSTPDEFVSIDLAAIAAEVTKDLEFIIADKNASVTIAPLPVIRGIRLQLTQLFSNLISNALKFSDKQLPEITISSLLLPPAAGRPAFLKNDISYYQLIFQDNGIGFEQEYAGQIFTIFQRLHNRQLYEGTGIGLALCQRIAENHSGFISASGEPGIGACFNVYLPVL